MKQVVLMILMTTAAFGLPVLGDARSALAQPATIPAKGELIQSMGQPRKWQPYIAGMLDWDRLSDKTGGQFVGGLYRDLANPNYGALAMVGEGYVSTVNEGEAGLRLMGASRFLALQAGADYSTREHEVNFILSFTLGLRRGGVVGKGSYFRADYLPGRDHSLNFGIQLPIFQPHMGKTRPRQPHVGLPSVPEPTEPIYEPGPELQEALAHLEHAADWVARFTTPFFDQDGGDDEKHKAAFMEALHVYKDHINLRDALYPQGHTFAAEIEHYHAALDRAFALAAGGDGLSAASRDLGATIAKSTLR